MQVTASLLRRPRRSGRNRGALTVYLGDAPVNLLVRLLLIMLQALRREPLGPLDTSVVTMHVWLTDLDLLMHMNNGRYLSLMDLGRVDLMIRAGFWREARRRGWYPVVGSTLIDYRRPLTVFQKFELRTRVAGWDERWVYLEQQIVRNGTIAAAATLKTQIRSATGAVSTADAMVALGLDQSSPPLSEHALLLAQKDRHNEII
jgi:acyl-CoA thioesterase FadM